MNRRLKWILAALCAAQLGAAADPSKDFAIVQRPWFETRTEHFNLYSCGAPREVSVLARNLELFREAYVQLGGAQQVESPPIIVIAFSDPESIKPFLPQYQGKPGNFSGFFKRGSDENLIVLALPGTNSAFSAMSLGVIFHEYAHLLFRRNAPVWPLWLSEGMAEVYSTFQMSGRNVLIAQPVPEHLRALAREPLMPLAKLFATTQDSPQYNEREHQGMFYAEAWLLTHFLMAGDVPAYRTRFLQFTPLLRQGQLPEEAFTNAMRATLPAMENQLRGYVQRGKFAPVQLSLPANVASLGAMNSRFITPVEICFLLGKELLHIGNVDAARSWFARAQDLAPASPLPYEGLGLLAARRERRQEAIRELGEAFKRGSSNFLAHYVYAREKYRLTADRENRYARLEAEPAAEIRAKLRKSIGLMPAFGLAQELLGFFEMVQGDDPAAAERHLQTAVQLEPDNQSYLLVLAQAQLRNKNAQAARRTLEPLLLPNVELALRKGAREMLREIDQARQGD